MKSKSIFTKQLILYIGTLVASFAILGFVLSLLYSEFYITQKEEQLIAQGEKLSQKIFRQFAVNFITGGYGQEEVDSHLEFIEEYMDASVFLMNSQGIVENATPKINQVWIGQTITDEAIKGVLNGKVVTVEGRVGGMFQESVLTVGYPVKVDNKTIGGIFMSVSMPEIQRSMRDMYGAGLVGLLFVMCIGAVMVYILSRKITMPLLQMNEAAKVIAGGDFEKKVEIKSDDEVGQLADSFNEMADSLCKHERVRRDFIANISHDLRSPLTSIQGFLGAMLDGTIPQQSHEKYIKIVLEETKRLTKLTNDIVELSRAQTSKITLERSDFDINELIRDSLLKLEPRFQEKNIKVDVVFDEQDTVVNADEEKIQRVFHNLVDNAIKFTPHNGRVDIETTITDGSKLTVSVRDNGRGISKEEQKYVFDRFYKADTSRGQDKKGGGLGLSIAKEFILAHGEEIGVKSEEGKGTQFMFTLKRA